jgi:hypothetical protein
LMFRPRLMETFSATWIMLMNVLLDLMSLGCPY